MHRQPVCHSDIVINPKKIFLFLTFIVCFLSMAHLAVHGVVSVFDVNPEEMFGLYSFFNLLEEANLPSYVSALNLLFAGLLLIVIASNESKRKNRIDWHWWILAAGLVLMSFDEASQIHEGLIGEVLLQLFGRGEGIFYYTWYLFYIPILLLAAFYYFPFLRKMPLRYSSKFFLSGLIFFGGAIGIEALESYLAFNKISVTLSSWAEETAEMMGIVILIYALLLYIQDSNYIVAIKSHADLDTLQGE